MDRRVLKNVVRTLTARYGPAAAVPDADLLRAFARDGDAEAFAELHRRHGPLVWAACRSMLPTPADAEDAYQATFLALVRSAGRVRNAAAVGAWLHGVAVKAALSLRRSAERRRTRERKAAKPDAERPVADAAWEQLLADVHQEVERLPTGQRDAFVLCDLQGVPQPDAAARLGCPLGSLSGRLSKARARLADRLRARGVVPSLAAGALGVAATGSEAGVVPPALAAAVYEFAGAPGAAPAVVQTLATEVMAMTHLKWTAAAIVAAGVMTLGLGTVMMPTVGGQQPPVSRGGGGRPAADPAEAEGSLPPLPHINFKYVPLAEGQTSEAGAAAVKRIETQAAQGWDFCGSLEMRLTRAEAAALRAGKQIEAAGKDADGDAPTAYRVLVFKQARPGADAPKFDPFARGEMPGRGSKPGNVPGAPSGMMPRGDDWPGAGRPGFGGLPGGMPGGEGAGPGMMGPGGGLGAPPAKVPSAVVYSCRNASPDVLEKVATSLVRGSGGSVTVIGDARTNTVIFTGDAKAIQAIIERLKALENDLGEAKPKPATKTSVPSLGVSN
ncbi:MAG: sigma-70 family RNA polymerase sigma factor [Gemmataceae bacterium]